MPIIFGQSFLTDPARADEREYWRKRITLGDRTGITRSVTAVVNRAGIAEELSAIDTPTLIIVGDEDVATPSDKSERMHSAIAGSKLVRIGQAGHTSTIEQPGAVTATLQEFLSAIDS